MKHCAAAVVDFDGLCFLAQFLVADYKLLIQLLGKVVYFYPSLVTLHREIVAA